jgi:hypothetical protein
MENKVEQVLTIFIQKRVMIASILGNSSNKNFNAFQSIIGFFCDSKRTPEIICEMLAHM